MARFTHQVALLKPEGTYGTDSVPVAGTAADVVLLRNVEINGIEGQLADRPRVQPWHGNRGRPGLHSRSVRLSGDVPLCGSGAAGTAPGWRFMMRACGMAEVITAATRVEYAPISAAQESVSAYWLMDGSRHRALGVRGDFTLNIVAGEEPNIQFNFTGLYSDPTAVSLPATVFTAWRGALVPRATITTCTIGGFTLPMRSLRYTHGNQVAVRDIPSRNEVRITDRSPTAEVVIEAPDGLSPANFFALASAESETTVLCQHGTAAGDVIEVRMNQARLLPGIRYGRDGDVAMLTLPIMPRPSAGNDEVLITAR